MERLPIDLVLVRHGQSEGNVAINASKQGDTHYFDIPGFRDRAGHDWRLTDLGITQAQAAGRTLRELFPHGFDTYYTSDFARAKETAALLQLPGADWRINIYLHEQLWGTLDSVPREELEQKYPGAHARRNRHRFYGSYPHGESMGEVCMRSDRVNSTLGRECTEDRVIMVCHGNVIWSFRMLFERLTPGQYHDLDSRDHPETQIHNGQIFHYTRRDPNNERLEESFQWWRTVRTASGEQVDTSWRHIVRPTFSDAALLKEVEKIPRLIAV